MECLAGAKDAFCQSLALIVFEEQRKASSAWDYFLDLVFESSRSTVRCELMHTQLPWWRSKTCGDRMKTVPKGTD
jgi:hypothetical protein